MKKSSIKSSIKKNSTKKGSILQLQFPQLTKTEAEIFYLLNEENNNVRRVALRRGTSTKAVYNIRKKLAKKGLIGFKNKIVEKNLSTIEPFINKSRKSSKFIRFHGIELNIKILWKNQSYINTLKKCNILFIDGSTIRLYKDALGIYVNTSFYGESVEEACKSGFKHINKLIIHIEENLKVILVKNRYQNIKMVSAHFSEVDNELAKETNLTGEKISIKTEEDGKVWFKIDNSFNLHEAETIHPETAQKDMQEVVKPFFNDQRKYPTLSSDILLLLKEIALQNKETASGLNAVVQLLKPSVPEPSSVKVKPYYVG